jgi:hypothetical protein
MTPGPTDDDAAISAETPAATDRPTDRRHRATTVVPGEAPAVAAINNPHTWPRPRSIVVVDSWCMSWYIVALHPARSKSFFALQDDTPDIEIVVFYYL